MVRRLGIVTLGLTVLCLCLAGCPQRGPGHNPGDVATYAGIQFVWCPSGPYWMGQDDSVISEKPRHIVIIAKGFWMSKYEITQKQWQDVMGNNPSYFKGDNRPVECVSWDDAKAFITALNTANPTMHFRLPSEAEWEYACRAGTMTRSYWGDDPDFTQVGSYAWYQENSDLVTHDVGGKLPNAWGLYDMTGNVWEWCEDDWHDSYTGAPWDGSAWIDSPRGSGRVARGGGFGDGDEAGLLSASRANAWNTTGSDIFIGFRIAR